MANHQAERQDDDDDEDELGFGALILQASQDYFSFESFNLLSSYEVEFTYSFSGVSYFRSTLRLLSPAASEPLATGGLDMATHGATLFNIGLCVLPWFWMGFGLRRVIIRAGYLDAEQVSFWEDLYLHCLAEYFYVNKIDIRERAIRLTVERDPSDAFPPAPSPPVSSGEGRRVLVPLGGGKDSIVVWDSLQTLSATLDSPLELCWCYVGDGYGEYAAHDSLQEVVSISQGQVVLCEHALVCPKWEACRRRVLTLCGHPWSLLCALDSSLACLVWGYETIVVGNERSADFGNNVTYMGAPVNHQFDKSSAFERRLRRYIRHYLAPHVTYFSALGHLWELQIMKHFTSHCTPYLHAFVSCNEIEAGSGQRWCRGCPKCLFVYTLLSAFLHPSLATDVLGQDLFQDTDTMGPLLLSLLGRGEDGVKPLDCVGTPAEVRLALRMARDRYTSEGLVLPPLLSATLTDSTAEEGQETVEPHEGDSIVSEEVRAAEGLPPWWEPLVIPTLN